jgi:excisionase family DNA binding protein
MAYRVERVIQMYSPNIQNIIKMFQNSENPNIILQVSLEDLKKFAEEILLGAKSIAMIEAEAAASGSQLISVDDAAKLLAVSKMTLYRWDKNGVLKKVEIGGKRRYRKSDIDHLIGSKRSNLL